MRKALILLLAVFCINSAYADKNGKTNVFVSIMPQKYFAEKIGGNLVNISVLVPSGTSPENFDPSPKQIVQLGSSDVYFTIGVPFENIFLDKLKAGKKKLVAAPCDKDVPKLRNAEHDEHEHGHEAEHHHHGEFDPHIWTDPELIKIIAKNMADTLSGIDPGNAAIYASNLENFRKELDALQTELGQKLAPYKGRIFYVYHSAYTYFAERFNLIQKSIETGEKEPTPAKLRELVNQANQDKVKTVFIQPEFPASGAKRVAEAIGGRTVCISVLEYDVMSNMRKTAALLAESFEE
jgi:zinc transport system substrate-binding protein